MYLSGNYSALSLCMHRGSFQAMIQEPVLHCLYPALQDQNLPAAIP